MERFPAVDVRASGGGLGVFALEPIRAGRRVLAFAGPRLDRAAVENAAATGDHDGFLQIGRDCFLGRSGGADDYVNHACSPNCYVEFAGDGIFLCALVDIEAGAELSFDYGLTQIDFPFRFHCRCGAGACRGYIGDIDEMPASLLREYAARGAIPPHIAELVAA